MTQPPNIREVDFIDMHGQKYFFIKRKWWKIWKPKYKRYYFLTLIQIAKNTSIDKSVDRIREILEKKNPLFDDIEIKE